MRNFNNRGLSTTARGYYKHTGSHRPAGQASGCPGAVVAYMGGEFAVQTHRNREEAGGGRRRNWKKLCNLHTDGGKIPLNHPGGHTNHQGDP